jgi:uncharacterized membrane protein
MTSRLGWSARRKTIAWLAVRLGGIAGILAVVLAVLLDRLKVLMPSVPTILTQLPDLVLVFWFFGISAMQRSRLGRLGVLGTAASVLGILSIVALNLLVAFSRTASGSWLNSFVAGRDLGLIFTAAGVTLVWGILALGTESLRLGLLPRGAVVLWMVGLLTSIITGWAPVGFVTIAGVLWSSLSLLRAWYDGTPATETRRESAATVGTPRLIPLDALRGMIMILMAIDHASLFVRRWHPFETFDQPLPDYPSLAAMFTRLATHPCAPGFFFLMGAGMLLFVRARHEAGWSDRRIAGQLALRGLLFIALEQLIVDVATAGKVTPFDFSILAGLGGAMILGIPFLKLGGKAQAIIGAGILLLMQLIPGWLLHADLGILTPIRLMLLPGSVGSAFVLYPPIPWLGIALLGMAFGRALQSNPESVYRQALFGGLACLALFPLLRLLGGFGNLRMPAGQTLIDFFNVVKYPPSLTFLLLSLGFDLVMLGLFSRLGHWLTAWARPLVVLGQAALYFFLVHWFAYAALGWAFPTPGGLPATYLVWILGLVALYPICKAYEAFKHHMPVASVWRMI